MSDERITTSKDTRGTMGDQDGDHDQGLARTPGPDQGGEGAQAGRHRGDGGARGAGSTAAAGRRRM